MSKNPNNKIYRKLAGVVVSDKMNKTRVVLVERLKKHKRYLKYYKVTKRFKAHDEKNEYKIGDRVIIQETRPISKEKRWQIISKL
jgi:small subunit ribosomal protein S17